MGENVYVRAWCHGETEKAYLISDEAGVYSFTARRVWIPKSQVVETRGSVHSKQGHELTLLVPQWLVSSNNIEDLITDET